MNGIGIATSTFCYARLNAEASSKVRKQYLTMFSGRSTYISHWNSRPRRKGELSPAGIDRGWPHQVVLPARFSQRGSGYREEPTSSARICRYAAGGTPSFTTGSGFTFTASPIQRMPINSCKGSAEKNSTRSNEGRAAIGRVGISLKLPRYSPCVAVASVCRRTIRKSKSS